MSNIARQRGIFWAHSAAVQRFFASEAVNGLFVFKTVLAALIALWLAYRLELESPKTAVVTVFIVMQARTGMVLAKGFYRALGTVIGSGVSLVLVAAFAQERVMFLVGLALWVGVLTAGATLYRNFQSYAFVLAGYTACLVGLPAAMDPNHAFEIAVTRLSEVLLGILVASVISGLVFPLSMRELLLAAAQKRFAAFSAATGRVLSFGVPRAQWGNLHLKAINDIVTLDSYRSTGIFDSRKTRLQNQTIQQMSADLIAAASTLYVLNQHMLRLNRAPMNPVREALDPLLAMGVQMFGVPPSTAEQSAQLATWVQEWQAEIHRHLPKIQARTDFTPPQQLAFDTALMLLMQFLDEFLRYGRSHAALQAAQALPKAGDESALLRRGRHATDFSQPLIAGLRTVLILGVMSVFWISTAWPTGVLALTIAVVVSALFSTAPNPAKAVFHMWLGIALSFAAAFIFQFLVLPNLHGFVQLALGLSPFFIVAAYLMTSAQWGVVGVGLGLFFSTLAVPDNMTVFNYAGLLNSGIGLLLAVSVAAIAFLTVMPMGNQLSRYRMIRALDRQLIAICQQPLAGLRPQFERDTRELLRQLASTPGLAPAHNAAALHTALTIQELGRSVLALRALIEPVAAAGLPYARSVQAAILALARFYQRQNTARLHAVQTAFSVAQTEVTALPMSVLAALPASRPGEVSATRQVEIYLALIQPLLATFPAHSNRTEATPHAA